MKKQYIKPETCVVAVQLQQIIAMSGVANTTSFKEEFTEETTDQALSRRRSFWDDEE